MGVAAGVGYTSATAILVLFILLVIVSTVYGVAW
ncbi:YjcZ family sporulation protein [Paenibacillus hexagrammi]|uniref:YjcZ family sporulation protein n=1 Tax=Paenibacillus hexagrammi TaxID=2908839 RepID=A0ABY3SG69_9BACL|nr:YjcZ family sporulation protein [Paenibacillus sp. YPD9-1]UJF32435.1 YjcZ family sporulation protein [Paenibacillus sp. YPD9-1]